ncbi:NADPH-dependent FMN reductase [Ferrovibrio sp.]|uniref:NADPH-dependent FMN reductase n=1 Tax=Ferrovibrio sp. TaxID=1917215 RepID=UPI00311D39BF
MAKFTVGYMIGSLAEESINRKLAGALVKLAPSELAMVEISWKDLPLYSYDYDKDYPKVAVDFKDTIHGADAILFVSPEYNRSIPGALKNAIDWASRPYGKNAFDGKPAAVIGASVGTIGTAVAQQHLKGVLGYCNMNLMQSPEGYITMKPDLISDDGTVTVDSTREFLTKFMKAFADHIVRVKA